MTKLPIMLDRGGMGLLLLAWTAASLGVLSVAL
jgi:hypothetical protein